jgi:hypothetical protein
MNTTLPSASSPLPVQAARTPRVSSSYVVWLGLVLYLLLVKVIISAFLPRAFSDPSQAGAFDWAPLGIFAALGLVGVWLSRKTGFPDAWDTHISNWRRLALPLLIGIGFAALYVVADLLTGFTKLIAARHGVTQQYTDPVSMALIFTSVPYLVEVLYRLLIIPVLLLLISNLILRGRGQSQVFWVLAVLTSALEPLSQYIDWRVLSGGLLVFYVAELFAINFTQAAFFRKYGFLAAILVRVGFYLVWHVLYVH